MSEDHHGLKRVVGVSALTASVVNLSVGAGIYVLPALIGVQLGMSAFIGFLLCGIMFTTIILCYVDVGKQVKTTGGSYAYVEAAFGPFPGFIVNWLFFFGWGIVSDAAVMNVVADSLSVIFPVFSEFLMRALLFFILISLMILINISGSRKSIQFIKVFTVIKMVPLIILIAAALFYIDPANLEFSGVASMKDFDNSAIILFFTFAGFETALNVSGEIKNPERTIPRGIIFGGLLVLLIYVFIQLIAQGVLGERLHENTTTPLASIAGIIADAPGMTILLLAAIVSGLTSVNGDVLSTSRLLYAGAKDNLFPKYLGRVHERFQTPHLAIFTYGLMIFIFSISGGFKQLAILASGALLLIYLAVVLASVRLRMRKNILEGKRMLGWFVIVPAIALFAIVYVLSNLMKNEVISIAVFIAVISVIYFIMKKVRILVFDKMK